MGKQRLLKRKKQNKVGEETEKRQGNREEGEREITRACVKVKVQEG